MAKIIDIAVLPVAGLGTRVMPLTLHQPKGMIGIVDRPIIHYVIDELVEAGARKIIFIVSPGQEVFKKYLEHLLKADPSWKKVSFSFIVQKNPRGNGDAVYLAKGRIKDKPFFVAFGDDLLAGKPGPLKQMAALFKKARSPIVMLEPVPRQLVSQYGIVATKKTSLISSLKLISDVVEKPSPAQAPSNLSIIGRYILTPDILSEIQKLYAAIPKSREIYLADALKNHARSGKKLYGWILKGRRFDGGSKLGILKAQAYFGLHHPEYGPEFKKHIRKLL